MHNPFQNQNEPEYDEEIPRSQPLPQIAPFTPRTDGSMPYPGGSYTFGAVYIDTVNYNNYNYYNDTNGAPWQDDTYSQPSGPKGRAGNTYVSAPSIVEHPVDDVNKNPGFCSAAWDLRQASLKGKDVHSPNNVQCQECGLEFRCISGERLCSSHGEHYDSGEPASKFPIMRDFKYQSHMAVTDTYFEQRLGCLICFENRRMWVEPMLTRDWVAHIKKHFQVEGYKICKDQDGFMKRKFKCKIRKCHRIHC